jgi:hypothetical protein
VLRLAPLAIAGLSLLTAACGKDGRAAGRGEPDDPATPAAPPRGDCGHSACGSNFFLDAAPVGDCVVGATCAVAVKLVATGEFHINDEYPYKIKADDAAGVEYLGSDGAGKNVFSKAASDWQKKDEKSGVMTLAFRASNPGSKTVGGTFKLSVCSAQNCQLEQQHVQARVAVR